MQYRNGYKIEVDLNTIIDYEEASAKLKHEVESIFPIGQVVIRDSSMNRSETAIYAVVSGYVDGRPDLIHLLYENGNIWTRSLRQGLMIASQYPEWAERLRQDVLKKTQQKQLS